MSTMDTAIGVPSAPQTGNTARGGSSTWWAGGIAKVVIPSAPELPELSLQPHISGAIGCLLHGLGTLLDLPPGNGREAPTSSQLLMGHGQP